jgi:hypothetical protein
VVLAQHTLAGGAPAARQRRRSSLSGSASSSARQALGAGGGGRSEGPLRAFDCCGSAMTSDSAARAALMSSDGRRKPLSMSCV